MIEPFPHDIRAILAAPGKGFSLKKIFAASVFLVAGYVCYTIFTYLALLYDGVDFNYIWQSYAVFPIRLFPFDSLIGGILYLIALVTAALSISLAIVSNAVINFEEMRGDYFYSASDSIRFAISRLPALLLGYISLGAFIGFICLLGLLVGLIGRVPYIGEVVISVFYLVPIFLTLALTVFIIFVAIVGIILLPVIIGSQREKEVFDSLLQLFSVIIKEPVRFVWYLALSGVLAKVSSFVMAYLFYRTLQFSRRLLTASGGEAVNRLFTSAYGMLPLDTPAVSFVTTIFPGVAFGFDIVRWSYGGGQSVGAVLLAISIFILYVILIGYMVSVLTAGLSRGYAVIRRMKDDYLIMNEEPLSPGEDYANPPFMADDDGKIEKSADE